MKRLLMIGLPESGKTTFIAALWALLNAPDVKTSLELRRYAGDRRRLETVARRWLSGQKMERTHIPEETWVELILAPAEGGAETVLHLPDLSGESFDEQWRDRTCSEEYRDAAHQADGLLLFIHSVDIVADDNLTEILREVAALEGNEIADATDAKASEDNSEPAAAEPDLKPDPVPDTPAEKRYNPDEAPTQLKLMDFLQILAAPPMRPRRRRLAVTLSAWDRASRLGRTPERYLQDFLPLLWQYLRSNPDVFETRVFGVSPQGKDMKDAGFMESVGRLPQERILVTDEGGEHHDLTRLLRWAGGDD